MILDEDTIKKFAAYLQAKGKFPATIESYCRDARAFIDFMLKTGLAPADLEPVNLVDFQKHLSALSDDKENSIRRKVIGIRQFFRFVTEAGLLPSSPFDFVPIPERMERLPSKLSDASVEKLFAACRGDGLKEVRDTAILSLLAFEGLKANELIYLKWSDFASSGDTPTIKVRGLRSRTIEVQKVTEQNLLRYRDAHQKHGAASPSDVERYMFIAFKGRDAALTIPKMTRHGLKFMLYEIGEKIQLKKLNTELLRHYSVTFLLAQGKSPEWIMNHMGLRRLGNIAKHMAARPEQPLGPDDRAKP